MDYLIIWPFGYTLEMEDDNIWVLNQTHDRVAKVGDTVRMGSGIIPDKFIAEKIGRSLPENCSGPCWLVSFEVEKEE